MSLLSNYLVIYLTYFAGLVCAIIPLPNALSVFRPDWMILIIFYWVLALPQRVNIGHAFILGILFDLLLGSTLGMHALLFSLLAYIVITNYQLFRYFTIVQTTLIVGLFSLFFKLSLYLMASGLQDIILHKSYFWSVLTSMLIWPWFFLLLRFIRLRFKAV
ncbi:MAG: rod shape-determining protein MreD [Psychromonas sp.]